VDASRYRDDIFKQPDALRAVADFYAGSVGTALMDAAVERLGRERLVGTGMGASFFALQATRSAFARSAGALWVEETGLLTETDVVAPGSPTIVVSQSGETIEARQLLKELRQLGTPAVLVTRDASSSLAVESAVVLPICVEADLSVAVKTYTGTVATLAILADHLAGGNGDAVLGELIECAAVMESMLNTWDDQLSGIADAIDSASHLYALGRRGGVGSALGTALLIKETAKRACEGQSSSQFRHGAIEVASDDTAVIVFASSEPAVEALDRNLVDELVRYGSRVVVVADDGFAVSGDRVATVRAPANGELTRSILEIVPMQLLAHRLAILAGITPGEFRNTVPVIVHA
jgi:glutamine---fructose-6-phosphate transaminase (isomerizing)